MMKKLLKNNFRELSVIIAILAMAVNYGPCRSRVSSPCKPG